jgi:WD40 repeat protein
VKSAKQLRQIDISKKLKNTWNDQEWDKIQGLTENPIKDHPARKIHNLSVSNDGKTLHMIAGPGEGPAWLKTGWNLETGKELHTHALTGTGELRIAMSPDGKTMAIGIRNGTVYFKDMKTGEVAGKLKAHKDRVWGLAYSSDGKFLATASRYTDGTVKVWRMSDMKEVVHIPKHADSNYGVAFSPDSSLLATASDKNRVRIWKLPALK